MAPSWADALFVRAAIPARQAGPDSALDALGTPKVGVDYAALHTLLQRAVQVVGTDQGWHALLPHGHGRARRGERRSLPAGAGFKLLLGTP